MRYRRLDSFGDMTGCRDACLHYEGSEAVGAAIRSRILSFQGEWWEDPDDGIPLESLIGRMDEEREQIADAMIRGRILETPGVVSIDEYRVDNAGTKRVVYLSVATVFGPADVEVSL